MHCHPGKFVYLIRSSSDAARWYVGLTSDVARRLEEHNNGRSPHTAKYRPWTLVVSMEFADEYRALAFENYLKTGSGRAFSNRHFR
jgi:putative endonuclease